MSFNLTLIGQMITFVLFVWFTMKYIWPYVIQALEDRQKQIAEGLAAAERGHRQLEISQEQATKQINKARKQASNIVMQAERRAAQIIEEVRHQANEERIHLRALANAEIKHEVRKTRQALQAHLADIIVEGAGRVIKKNLDVKAQEQIIEDVIKDISRNE